MNKKPGHEFVVFINNEIKTIQLFLNNKQNAVKLEFKFLRFVRYRYL